MDSLLLSGPASPLPYQVPSLPPSLSSPRDGSKNPPAPPSHQAVFIYWVISMSTQPRIFPPICKHKQSPSLTLISCHASVHHSTASWKSCLDSLNLILPPAVGHFSPSISPKFLLPRPVMTSKVWNPNLRSPSSSKPTLGRHQAWKTVCPPWSPLSLVSRTLHLPGASLASHPPPQAPLLTNVWVHTPLLTLKGISTASRLYILSRAASPTACLQPSPLNSRFSTRPPPGQLRVQPYVVSLEPLLPQSELLLMAPPQPAPLGVFI